MVPQKELSINKVHSCGLKLFVLGSKKWFRFTFLILIVCFYIFGYGYSIYGKSTKQLYSSTVTVLVEQVAYFLLTLSNLSNSLGIVNFEKYRQLINELINHIASKPRTRILFGIISYLANGFSILCLALNAYFFMSFFGWNYYQYYWFKDIQFCLFNLIIFSNSELFYTLRDMFFDLNQELLSIYNKLIKDNQATTSIDGIDIAAATSTTNLNLHKINVIYRYKTPKCLATLRKLTKKHNKLCHLADQLNEYVGIIIFLQIISIIANIVWPVIVLIEYDIREVAMKKIDPSLEARICHIGYNLAWILSLIGQTIFIALVGRALTQEGQNTSIYCYKILNNRRFEDHHQDTDDNIVIKNQLILLANQAENRCPVVSAAGFFVVDLEILGLVSTNVIALGIVAIQFVLNEP